MNLNRNLLKHLTIATFVIIPIAFILRLVTYFKELEITTGFFREDGIFSAVYNGIGFGIFFLCLALSFVKKDLSSKKKKTPPAPQTLTEEDVFPFDDSEDRSLLEGEVETVFEVEEDPRRFFKGVGKRISMWSGPFSAFATLLPGFGFIAYAFALFFHGEEDSYRNLFAILSLLSGLFFLVFAFRNSPVKNKFMAFFALIPALWCTARMVIEYRDLTRFMNKSLYTGQFLFIIAAMIFFLYQAQLLLGEDVLTKPNFYAFPALCVVFFGLTARVPELIAGIGGKISMDLIASSSLLIDLAITLFVAVKLKSILKSNSN